MALSAPLPKFAYLYSWGLPQAVIEAAPSALGTLKSRDAGNRHAFVQRQRRVSILAWGNAPGNDHPHEASAESAIQDSRCELMPGLTERHVHLDPRFVRFMDTGGLGHQAF